MNTLVYTGAGSVAEGSGLQAVIWERNLDIVQGNTRGPGEQPAVACPTAAKCNI